MTLPTAPPPIGAPTGPGDRAGPPPLPTPPPPPPPLPLSVQEPTGTPDEPSRVPWFERRATLVVSAVVAVIGAVLIGFGVIAFASAANTNRDAQPTKDQVAALQNETSSLQQELDAKRAEAASASAADENIATHTDDLRLAVIELHLTTHDTVAAYNNLSECTANMNDAAFIACTNSWLTEFDAAVTEELNAVADTRAAIATLEEDLRA